MVRTLEVDAYNFFIMSNLVNNILITSDPILIKLLPFDFFYQDESNGSNFIKIGVILTELYYVLNILIN